MYLAVRNPNVLWVVKVFALCVAAYAINPIDLIPDPIPVVAYLDDFALVPLGIWLATKMISPEVMEACRLKASHRIEMPRGLGWIMAAIIVLVWIILAGLGYFTCGTSLENKWCFFYACNTHNDLSMRR